VDNQFKEEVLSKESLTNLVGIYNKIVPGKPVKKFASKKYAIERIQKMAANLESMRDKPSSKKPTQATLPSNGHPIQKFIERHAKLTNAEFAELSRFKKMCESADLLPSTRQAAKFREGRGAVFYLQVIR